MDGWGYLSRPAAQWNIAVARMGVGDGTSEGVFYFLLLFVYLFPVPRGGVRKPFNSRLSARYRN
jgi:hypothetical protein